MNEAEWLSDIPTDWEVKNLRFIGEVILGLTYSPADVCDAADGTLVIRASNIRNGKLVHADDVFVSSAIPPEIVNRAGDIIVCSRNGSRQLIGKSAVVSGEWAGQTFGAFMTTVRSRYPEWMSWILSSSLFTFQSGRYMTSTINQLTTSALKSFAVPLPPLETQKRIAAFLDEKTAQIDALIARKQALLATLAEKRQAIITQGVTKGLNPAAPLKDSGIDWLGQIPAHWEVMQVKRTVSLATSGPRGWSDLAADEGAVFFQSQNIGRGMTVELTNAKRIEAPAGPDAKRARLNIGDVVVCITGARTGAVAAVDVLDEDCFINQHVCLLRPIQEIVDGRFLAFFLFGRFGQEQLAVSIYGLKQGLGLEDVRAVQLTVPSIAEQQEIVLFLDEQAGLLAELATTTDSSISRLTEYRSALITAAVTGQIEGLR